MEHKIQNELTALEETVKTSRLIPNRVKAALIAEIAQTNQSVVTFFDVSCSNLYFIFVLSLYRNIVSYSICLSF